MSTSSAQEAHLSVRVPVGLKRRLEELAKRRHTSISVEVRLAVERGLTKPKGEGQ